MRWLILVLIVSFTLVTGSANSRVADPAAVCSAAAGGQVANPAAISSAQEDLAPGAILHTVAIVYRRKGGPPAPVEADESPECSTTEEWMEFDDAGSLASYDGERRDIDGPLSQTWKLEGDDLIFRYPDGAEIGRTVGFKSRHTVQSEKDGKSRVMALASDALADHPNAPIALGSEQVLVLEERRFLPPRQPYDPSATGYTNPFIADLVPRERVLRSYILPSVPFMVKSEVLIIGEDGEETVAESMEFRVFEVIVPTPDSTPPPEATPTSTSPPLTGTRDP